jgi:hypothetical protein
MAKLAELAVYRPVVSFLVCLRCRMSVGIENAGSSVRLLYDFDDWQQRDCCCRHIDGPANCCSFDDLRQALYALPVPN